MCDITIPEVRDSKFLKTTMICSSLVCPVLSFVLTALIAGRFSKLKLGPLSFSSREKNFINSLVYFREIDLPYVVMFTDNFTTC